MNGKLSNRSAVAVGGGVLLLVLVAFWFLVVSPKRSEASDLKTELATAQTELDQKKADLANPSAAVNVRPSDVFRLTKALPQDSNMAGVILDVDRIARTHKLTLEGFQPTAAIPMSGYTVQPLTVTVQGRFGDVSKFLKDVRDLVTVKHGRLFVNGRLYSVSEVRLGKPDVGTFPIVRAGVILNAYGFAVGAPATTTPTTPGTDSTTPSSDGTTSAAGATP